MDTREAIRYLCVILRDISSCKDICICGTHKVPERNRGRRKILLDSLDTLRDLSRRHMTENERRELDAHRFLRDFLTDRIDPSEDRYLEIMDDGTYVVTRDYLDGDDVSVSSVSASDVVSMSRSLGMRDEQIEAEEDL